MEEKPRKRFYISTKSGKNYSVVADFLKYEYYKNDIDTLVFKKDLPDQTNDDGSTTWDVAFIKAADVEIVGIETYLKEDPIPYTYQHLTKEIAKSLLKVGVGVLVFALTRRLTHV